MARRRKKTAGMPKKGMKAIGEWRLKHPTKKMRKMSAERRRRYVYGGLRKTGIKKYGKKGFEARRRRGLRKRRRK